MTETSPVASVRPLSPATFPDLDRLFAQSGCSFARSCWCMAHRIGRGVPESEGLPGDYRRRTLQTLAEQEPTPGLIGYDGAGEPVGWVAVGPREAFAALQRSPIMKPVDSTPAWVVPCFVVPTPQRGRGVAKGLLRHALDHAKAAGGR